MTPAHPNRPPSPNSRWRTGLFALLAMMVALVFSACGSDETEAADSTASEAASGSASEPADDDESESAPESTDPAAAEAEEETESETVSIQDHWERTVEVPLNPERVVVMEWEGLVTKSMRILGVDSTLVGVDTATKKMGYREELIPAIGDAVDLGSPWSGVNYEELVNLDPDVVFMEAWVASEENRTMHQDVIDQIEGLGFPVVVLISPSNFDDPDIETAWQHITITGDIFGQRDEADALVAELDERLEIITERTADIPDDERTDVAYFSTINYVMGEKSIQDYLLTEIVGANNVADDGTFVTISEEQLLALDPDAMVIAGHEGYLDTSVVYEGGNLGLNWGALQDLRAIQDERLVALGYDEWRATIEMPIALLKVAKVVYPDLFEDIDVEQEELDFYRDVYGMDEVEAKEAIAAQEFIGELEG